MNTRPAAALLLDRHAQYSDLPLKWDEKEVVWKTRVHDRGWYSPVIEVG